MERMCMELLGWVSGMTLVFAPLVVWLTLLNLGDRRSRRLRAVVYRGLAFPSLRGRFTVRIRCPLPFRRGLVVVEILAGTPHEIWDIFTRLANVLPLRVTLRVHNTGDCQRTRPFMLQTVTSRRRPRRLDSALAGG
jgi:hypothetical protein